MKGYIEIYQGKLTEENLIFSEDNMIVDGAGHQVVDILSTLPIPASMTVAQTSSILDFGIKAITLGCAKGSASYNSYNISSDSGPSSIVAIPPTPTDTTLQPPIYISDTSGPGRLGHFLNYYNFSGSYPSLNNDEIQEHGCYLSSSGNYFEGSSFGYTHDGSIVNDMSGLQIGDLNSASAINSEGYILESKVARSSQSLADASGGFLVSGIADLSATREVKYILTISYKDWKFLDYYYGGIGAIGLWTLDRDATLDKYDSESEAANINLYNITDITKNPVFKLFSKKVFLPGGLQLNESSSNDDYITITWGIKF